MRQDNKSGIWERATKTRGGRGDMDENNENSGDRKEMIIMKAGNAEYVTDKTDK